MKILLIRHATRTRNPTTPEKDDPLSDEGKKEAEQLAEDLDKEGDKPTLILTSEHRHAQQTARILHKLNPKAVVLPLAALTPGHPNTPTLVNMQKYFDAILQEVKSSQEANQRLTEEAVVFIVTHHPRQLQIAIQLQGKPPQTWQSRQQLAFAGAVCVIAEGLEDFKNGKGEEVDRLPYGKLRWPR
jgi:phosphohistidine phosphatase SixA